ncbi:hypothetical protein [Kitasatospora sp. NPDC088783]|uniref:hypothetical protein n=1 Tax=Kitasatospora sp. NPDC088783 TaxID=3364077 RepID=UPI0038236624
MTRPVAAELRDRERRLLADRDDAEKALNNARRRYDAICDELQETQALRRAVEEGARGREPSETAER